MLVGYHVKLQNSRFRVPAGGLSEGNHVNYQDSLGRGDAFGLSEGESLVDLLTTDQTGGVKSHDSLSRSDAGGLSAGNHANLHDSQKRGDVRGP